MKLQLSKWGNSLAVRLPMEWIRTAGLKEGDELEAELTCTGEIRLVCAQVFDKGGFLRRVRALRAGMPMTRPVVESMRQEDRY